MTNSFVVAVMVLWKTNTMDVLLTPVGNDIMRSTIVSQAHVYTIPGHATVTNLVPVLTNSVHLRMRWQEVEKELPPVPIRSPVLPIIRGSVTNTIAPLRNSPP